MHFASSSNKKLAKRRPLVITNSDATVAAFSVEEIDAQTGFFLRFDFCQLCRFSKHVAVHQLAAAMAKTTPELADIVVPAKTDDEMALDGEKTSLYELHLQLRDIEAGVKDGLCGENATAVCSWSLSVVQVRWCKASCA